MRGITQREYDGWRKQNRRSKRSVKQIGEQELHAIYRGGYWDRLGCDGLPAGLDLCVFDAGVNSGVARAEAWLAEAGEIDSFCDRRLAFLKQTGRLWRVFGQGWRRRVAGIRVDAHAMAGDEVPALKDDNTLHAGMRGGQVRHLQKRLRRLGYPCGLADGIFGEQTHRAVILFQQDHDLAGDAGVWLPDYEKVLDAAEPMLPKRKVTTARDLETAGDPPMRRLGLLQRVLAWFFGASAVAQVTDGSSVLETMGAVRSALEPVQGLLDWASGHRWLLIALLCAGSIALVRNLRTIHVSAFQNFDYQGQPPKENK